MRTLKKQLRSFIFTKGIEHRAGKFDDYGIVGLYSAYFSQCRFCRLNATFSDINLCEMRPCRGVVSVELYHRLKCVVSDFALLSLQSDEANEEVRWHMLRIIAKRLLAGLACSREIAAIQCSETISQ